MKAYVLSIAGVILISAVVSVISPGGKMGKFTRGMTRLFVVSVLVAPFAGLVSGKETLSTTTFLQDEHFSEVYADMLVRCDEEEIAALLSSEFGVGAEIEVSRSFDDFSHEKIVVRVTDFGINGEETHIDILSAIGDSLHARFGCPVEVT